MRSLRATAAGLLLLGLVVGACEAPAAAPSQNFDSTGILLVGVGEEVQARPPNEAMGTTFSSALLFAEANGNDVGYPWIDPATGELVLSAATPHGRDLLSAQETATPHRIRDVAHGATELRQIQDAATFLGSQGVPGAELMYMTGPDQRDNRALIVISAMSRPLLEALVARFPADALAIQVAPLGAAFIGSSQPAMTLGATTPVW